MSPKSVFFLFFFFGSEFISYVFCKRYYSTFTDTESGSDEDESEFLKLKGRNDEKEIEESKNILLDQSFDEELNGIGEFIRE